MGKNAVVTKHRLDFEMTGWNLSALSKQLADTLNIKNDDKYPDIEWLLFRVGTCEGQYRVTPEAYEILSIVNKNPGNGHLIDLLEWFEYACKRSKLPLRILEFTNEKFKKHLIEKKGFHLYGKNDVEKKYHHKGSRRKAKHVV